MLMAPMHAGLGGLDRVELVMHRRGGAREIVDLVDFDVERKSHVVAHQLKAGIAGKMLDIAL